MVAGRVHDQTGGLVEGADDVAGGVDHVPGGRVERADDVAGGVHDDRAVHGRCVGGGGGVGSRAGGIGRSQQCRVAGGCAVGRSRSAGVASAGVASAPPVTVSDWSIVLSWRPVAIASASTCWVTMTPWSVSACEVEPLARMLALTRPR